MITEIKDKSPFISFGFSQTNITVQTGVNITLWVEGFFDNNKYTSTLETIISFTKISEYEYILDCDNIGDYNIKLLLFEKQNPKIFKYGNNTATLNVE
ncbi:hypothetical protein [Flavobacterium rhizosphaerae]|uniref:Uncharacterized protein n=1 Tax=Flavobacterium rhizosphaerae TaxID=3163298 RepID=A0ABW8Z178_9FLAO